LHIILVPSRLAAARSFTLGPAHLAVAASLAMLAMLLLKPLAPAQPQPKLAPGE